MKYEEERKFLKEIIDYLSDIPEDAWLVDRVISRDFARCCVMGHIFKKGKTDEEGSGYWDLFESMVATTYMIYPVNDGTNPKYQQPTPKQRNLAYLNDILEGREETTMECMDRCMAEYNAKQLMENKC